MRAPSAVWRATVLFIAGTLGLVGAFASGVTAQSSPNYYFALASADGVRVSASAKGLLPVDPLVDVGAPTAHAGVDSLGNSVGFAGFPWPGDAVVGNIGLVRGATGAAVVDYPLVVQSSASEPEAEMQQGPVRLLARSDENSSDAVSQGTIGDSGVSAGTVRSEVEARRDPSTGVVTSTARTVAEAVSIDGVLTVGLVESFAEVTSRPGEDVQRASSVRVSNVKIAGQSVGVTENGLAFADSESELPSDDPLAEVLDEAGISLDFLQAEETKEGMIAGGLRIRVERENPVTPKPLVVVLQFGRAAAHAQAAASAPADLGGEFGEGFDDGGFTGGGGSEDGASEPSGSSGAGTALAATSGGGSGSAGGSTAPATPPQSSGSASGAGSEPTRQDASAAPVDVRPSTSVGELPSVTSGAFYLVLVLGGLTLFGGGQLIRVLAVRSRWTS